MPKLNLTRLVIETKAPMAINSGHRETSFDTQLVRDANGLPYIPGTSIAGVWRNLTTRLINDSMAELWFGSTEQRSRITIGNGQIVNSQNEAVSGLISGTQIEQDSILSKLILARPHHRDRVAINDRGVASEKAKFDQILLPKGVRFCIELQWFGEDDLESEWQALLALWQTKLFALGANTRNGLGQVSLVGLQQQFIDLADLSGVHPADKITLFDQQPLPISHQLSQVQQTPLCELTLQGDAYWRFGRGSVLLGNNEADIISYSEPSLVWQQGKAQWQSAQPVLCGSAIKGILAHRVAFHYNRLTERFAESLAEESNQTWETRPAALAQLFGQVEQFDEHNNVLSEALAGRLIIEDSPVEFNPDEVTVRYHNSIDRFTGGVRKGALYTEELLYQPILTVRIWLLPGKAIDSILYQAFERTLDDLAQGLLPLGAGAGRGVSLLKPQPITYHKENLVRLTTEVGL